MNQLRILILIGGLTFFAGVTNAQVRTWGFSKDTVFEGPSQTGGDSVFLANQGSDTLRFDTVIMEILKPTAATQLAVKFLGTSPNAGYFVWFFNGAYQYSSPSPKSIIAAPGQSKLLHYFYVDVVIAPLAKKAETAAAGDSMQARLIFQASGGRGRDTLMVNGIQHTTSIHFMNIPGTRPQGSGRFYDIRGRRIEEAHVRMRSTPFPLVTPK